MFSYLKFSSLCSFFLLMYSVLILPYTLMFFINQNCILIEWSVLQISSCSISFMVILDEIRLSFRNVVVFISGCVILFSSSYMSGDPFLKRFIVLVLLFVFSMNFLIFIPSLPALLLGWDGLGIVSFALVIYYQNVKRLGAGMITILANRIGDVIILIRIGLLVLQGHWVVVSIWDFYIRSICVLTLVIAAITKRAQIPFSRWLPAAMAAPTPVSALVHSSTLVTAGVYLVIRFYPFLSTIDFFNPSLFLISILTILLAGIGANFENDLKKIIALSTLSQLGVIIMRLGLGLPYLALFHLYTHALFKALLFLCAGNIIHNRSNAQDVRYIGYISYHLPMTVTCVNVANLSLCGAPFLSGFYSKDLILEFCLFRRSNALILIIVFLATGMTAAYRLRLSFSSFWSPIKNFSFHEKNDNDLYVNISICILALIAVVGGLIFQRLAIEFKPIAMFMPTWIKILTIRVILLGIYFSSVLWDERKSKQIDKIKYFFSTIWFLRLISSQPLSKFRLKLGENLIKSVDYGWLEVIGGQGRKNLTVNISINNQTLQIKLFNLLIMFIVFFILIFVVIILV